MKLITKKTHIANAWNVHRGNGWYPAGNYILEYYFLGIKIWSKRYRDYMLEEYLRITDTKWEDLPKYKG